MNRHRPDKKSPGRGLGALMAEALSRGGDATHTYKPVPGR